MYFYSIFLYLYTIYFSQIVDIPYSTINNWGFTKDDKTISVPKWVVPFLEHYEKSK